MAQLSSLYPISFVLPVYNVEKYLAEALESILRQTIEKEIILVDDGSTDKSLEIALDYARRYPFVSVLHGVNRGVSAARNKGLSLARGEYVLFLDPDDLIEENLDLAHICRLAQQHGVDVVKGQFVSYSLDDPATLYPKQPIFAQVGGSEGALAELNDFLQLAPYRDWFIQIACFLFKRELLAANRLYFDETLHFSEEGLFFTDVFCCSGRFLEVPDRFMHYRMRHGSAMTAGSAHKRVDSLYRVIELLRCRAAAQPEPKLAQALDLVRAFNCFFLHCTLNELPEPLQAQYRHLLTDEMVADYRAKGIAMHPF